MVTQQMYMMIARMTVNSPGFQSTLLFTQIHLTQLTPNPWVEEML